MDSNANEKPVIMYVGLYALFCAISLTAGTIIHSIFSINIGTVAIPFIVGVYTATRFIKARDRLITTLEKVKLITGTIVCTVLINVLNAPDVLQSNMFTGNLPGGFLLDQALIVLNLCIIFGPGSTYIYYSSKK